MVNDKTKQKLRQATFENKKPERAGITRQGVINALTLKGANYARIVIFIGACSLTHAWYKMKTRSDEEEF